MASKSYTGKRAAQLSDYEVKEFFGINTAIKDLKSIPKGMSPDALNWITSREGDHIELRRGQAILGKTINAGVGKITGIKVGTRYDGVQVPFFTYLRKIKYYDATADDTVEVGTDTLPASASGEDVSLDKYSGLAGAFMYLTSPNSSIYKIPLANPGSVLDQLSTEFKGKMNFGEGRMNLWAKKGSTQIDPTGFLQSWIDKNNYTQLNSITGEAVGALGSTTYTGTLKIKSRTVTISIATPAVISATAHGLVAGTPIQFSTSGALPTGITAGKTYWVMSTGLTADAFQISDTKTGSAINTSGTQSGVHTVITPTVSVMYVNILEAGGETFFDDRNGGLTGSQGSKGTINYATGVYSVTFNHTTTGAVTANYNWEDATNQGVCDFSFNMLSRVKGTGNAFRQDTGGITQNAMYLNNILYVFHALKTWQMTFATDDSTQTNLPYRSAVGIPYFLGAFPVNDGILYLDYTNPSQPFLRKLTVSVQDSTNIIPVSLSDDLDLSLNAFDKVVVFQWGDYDILSCQNVKNGSAEAFNGVTYIRNRIKGYWDKLDYNISCLDIFSGALIGGDSLQNNVNVLFSGFDDFGTTINNYWTSGDSDLGIAGLKKCKRIKVEGLIQKTQKLKVSIALDGGSFVDVFTIDGSASYVDQSKSTVIGGPTIGSKTIGGGGTVTANPYQVEFHVNTDIFENIRIRFEALDVGYVSISNYRFKDLRYKGRHSRQTYIA